LGKSILKTRCVNLRVRGNVVDYDAHIRAFILLDKPKVLIAGISSHEADKAVIHHGHLDLAASADIFSAV